MPEVYERDLDLNLLRVFAVVAEVGSVTEAAARLYLTQPAVSAALKRLTTAVGAPLLSKSGRSLVLTSRGARLRDAIRLHLGALVEAAVAPAIFDPKTSERSVRLGLSDAAEVWLLPDLLRVLAREAPRMRVISIPVQFRSVGAALGEGLDAAVTVADELPRTISRLTLFEGGFACLIDPRKLRVRRLTAREYFARAHVIVSYNGDLRGVVEDSLGKTRRVRCSVSSFASLGALLEGSDLVATVPERVAARIQATRPNLQLLPVPVPLRGAPMELLWPESKSDDPAGRFVREQIAAIARAQSSR